MSRSSTSDEANLDLQLAELVCPQERLKGMVVVDGGGGGGQERVSNERDDIRCGCIQGEARDFQDFQDSRTFRTFRLLIYRQRVRYMYLDQSWFMVCR